LRQLDCLVKRDKSFGLGDKKGGGLLGTLSKLSLKQEELKGRIIQLLNEPDPEYADAILRSLVEKLPIEEVVNCAIIHAEMDGRRTDDHDLAWASHFLDLLDTIGWKITPKTRAQRRRLPSVQKVQPVPGDG
jgi:hypothetical protein